MGRPNRFPASMRKAWNDNFRMIPHAVDVSGMGALFTLASSKDYPNGVYEDVATFGNRHKKLVLEGKTWSEPNTAPVFCSWPEPVTTLPQSSTLLVSDHTVIGQSRNDYCKEWDACATGILV